MANETSELTYTASIGLRLSKWNKVFEKKILAERAIRPSQNANMDTPEPTWYLIGMNWLYSTKSGSKIFL